MYNRYIPQPDGSYRRNWVEDPKPKPQATPKPQPEPRQPPVACPPPPPSKQESRPRRGQKPSSTPSPDHDDGIGHFLRQLLPKDFDTGDLIVILLLLLMAGDCEEDRANALLTLALYLIL